MHGSLPTLNAHALADRLSYSACANKKWDRTVGFIRADIEAARRPPVPPAVREIVDEIAQRDNIPAILIYGRTRVRAVAYARFEAWSRLRDLNEGQTVQSGTYSYNRIAKWFGRDHSTVMSGVTKWRQLERQRHGD